MSRANIIKAGSPSMVVDHFSHVGGAIVPHVSASIHPQAPGVLRQVANTVLPSRTGQPVLWSQVTRAFRALPLSSGKPMQ